MPLIGAVYIVWAGLMLALATFWDRRKAIWIALLGGWIFLPPAVYPTTGDPDIFPFWIIGGALPSDIMINKAWVAPLCAISVSVLFDRHSWVKLKGHWSDIAMALFCLWPFAQGLLHGNPPIFSLQSSLYMLGVWALPWMIGRIYLRNRDDIRCFAAALIGLTVLLLPIAIVEGLSTIRIHSMIFGTHPFTFDGWERYVGYRPQAFFEHGNQYGLWCAAAALAAGWRYCEARHDGQDTSLYGAMTIILTAMTILSQSVGAIILLLFWLGFVLLPAMRRMILLAAPVLLVIGALAGALHISGVVPVRSLVETSSAGQQALQLIRATGRGSFAWRIGQDLKALPNIQEKLLAGHDRWDWFRTESSRPWGLILLILGQYGLVGLVLMSTALIAAFYRHIVATAHGQREAILCCGLLGMASLDALLNSFLFYPAIILAGAIILPHGKARDEGANEGQDPKTFIPRF